MITNKDILVDLHVHTIKSGHAYSTLFENHSYAKEVGLKKIAITDHFFGERIEFDNELWYFLGLKECVDKSNIDILAGIELNIGQIHNHLQTLKSLNVRIGSIHNYVQDFRYKPLEYLEDSILHYVTNRYINILGHPCRGLYEITALNSIDGNISIEFKKYMQWLIDLAKKYNIPLEVNEASLAYDERNAGYIKYMLELAKENKNLISLGSDSHICFSIGKFDLALKMLNETNFPMELIINCNGDLLNKLFYSNT